MFKNFSKLAFALWALTATIGYAQSIGDEAQYKPYDELSIPSEDVVGPLQQRVLYFAHFTCPYCRKAHTYIEEWGDQLPDPYQLEVVPAVGLKEHIPMAIAYYAVLQIRPTRLRDYEAALFVELQDRDGDVANPWTYREAAKTIGIPEEEFNAAAGNDLTMGMVERAYALTTRYQIVEVPTVVLANRYRTGPGRVYNEQQAFVSLLNGLISMDFRERYSR